MKPSPRYLVLTVDSEIFGNGTGDVRRHVVEPNKRLADVCERFNVPLTVFFETEEWLAFDHFRGPLTKDLGYDPASLMADQARDLVRRGHDIQLHLHPEWFGSRYQSGHWSLHPQKRSVDELFPTQKEVTQYLSERKATLESLSGKPVNVYRAGAFTAQPGERLLGGLKANDILIDSSVVKGLIRRGSHISLDYRKAPCRKGPWRVTNDVAREAADGAVWEFPIYSVSGRRWQQATMSRMRAKFSKNVPMVRQKEMVEQLGITRNPLKLLKFLFEPTPIKLDFHNLSPNKMLSIIRSAPAPQNGLPDVLIVIGHSKEHLDDHPLEKFLKIASADHHLTFITFAQLAQMMKRYEVTTSISSTAAPLAVVPTLS